VPGRDGQTFPGGRDAPLPQEHHRPRKALIGDDDIAATRQNQKLPIAAHRGHGLLIRGHLDQMIGWAAEAQGGELGKAGHWRGCFGHRTRVRRGLMLDVQRPDRERDHR
jgi:hypothetical protein